LPESDFEFILLELKQVFQTFSLWDVESRRATERSKPTAPQPR
jgi:hypothetical protein